jgi:hypothetical protein
MLAIGDGLSGWYWAPRAGKKASQCRCLCGMELPSFSHLLWNCEITSRIRQYLGLALPTDRAEERLLLTRMRPQPLLPPHTLQIEDIMKFVSQSPGLTFGTDGGLNHGIVAWGVSNTAGGSIADAVPTEEESAFAGEVYAIVTVVEAVERLGVVDQTLNIIYDCKGAVDMLTADHPPTERYGYYFKIQGLLAHLQSRGVLVVFTWIPSHGKRPQHQCDNGFDTATARRLNDEADKAVDRTTRLISQKSGRGKWHHEYKKNIAQRLAVFHYAAAVADMFQASL